MTTLWRVSNGGLVRVASGALSKEDQLEKWIADDPNMLGIDIMLIGRQVTTDFGGRIDLLGIGREGDLTLIELKRDRTPREVVAQVLDYASWVSKLTTKRVHDLALAYLGQPLPKAFRSHFDAPLPENLNSAHNMVIVAASLDSSSQRIVEYLAQDCGVSINTAFFNFFQDSDREYLTADWLMDQDEVSWKAESKTKAPWSGIWYVNVDHGQSRSWEDMRKYGFIAAGGKPVFSSALAKLTVGDPIFAYQRKAGYVGFGYVSEPSTMVKDLVIDGKPLLSQPLDQPNLGHDQSDPEKAEHAVRVDWKKTISISEAKKFDGAFANQNIVCRLRDQQTIEFLKEAFDASI